MWLSSEPTPMLISLLLLSTPLLAAAPTLAQAPGEPLALERIVQNGQGFIDVVDLHVAPPGTPARDDLYIADRRGRIVVVSGGAVKQVPFADIQGLVLTNGDTGLRCFQFHPDYANNGHCYIWFDEDNGTAGLDGVLVRMTRAAGVTQRLDPATMVEILRVPQDGRSHGGGAIHFDAAGMLMLAIGDGAPGGDPFCRAQDPSNLLGTLIRIDVDGGFPYAIPADNPFVGMPGYAPEVVHFGLRHPWKWALDPVTGATWIADVGEFTREEINYVPPGVRGLNFGWNLREGAACFPNPCVFGMVTDCTSTALTEPVFEYDHSNGCSVTGGAVYRGAALPSLTGAYLFTDFCSRRIWSTRADGSPSGFTTLEHPITRFPSGAAITLLAAVGVDADGELLFSDYIDGEIYRLAPMTTVETVCPGMPNRTGAPAILTFTGSPSIAADDIRFEVHGAPPFALGVLFYGPDVQSAPLGNGVLCVGSGAGGLVRVDYRVSSASGTIAHVSSLANEVFSAPGYVSIGSTCYFQTWYRDVGGPLGQSTNLSSALSLRFRP